jgi:hypothetical protein
MHAAAKRAYDWTAIWDRHLDGYLSAPPRAGIVIVQTLCGGFDTALEIACGSARDSLFLQSVGKQVVATDSNPDVISKLQKQFSRTSGITFRVEDAASLSFEDNQFDTSFHNGFYICFDDDEIIKALLREQCRVTRKHALFFVHNAHNRSLRDKFLSLARDDSIFDVRFYGRDEITTLVHESGVAYRDMLIGKFGGPLDALVSRTLKGFRNPLRTWALDHLRTFHRLTPLAAAERLVCHITL